MDSLLKQAWELKQDLTDFVLDAEGELAVALEKYVAKQAAGEQYDIAQQNQTIDLFLTEGQVEEKTPLDLFIETRPDLTQADRQLLENWRQSFTGLFEVTQVFDEGWEFMNWLTAKRYSVKPNSPQTAQDMKRFKVGEILLTRISPLTEQDWMLSSAPIPKGKLGKPKLAVAIGNFKQQFKHSLYCDAPDLLEESWRSVERYHQDFVEFFGSDEVTLPGYQLNKKIAELQEFLSQKRLAEAGLDNSKSLNELAQEAGVSETEVKAAAQEAGADAKAVEQLFNASTSTKMVAPKVELPERFKKAEQVTALSHPRWGQLFLSNYALLQNLLAAADWETNVEAEKWVRRYLEDPEINAFVWQRLAQQFPQQLETILQKILSRPDFKLSRDLEALLQEYQKSLEPELPEIASVPQHLHDLFQDALTEVNHAKSKPQDKKKSKGFKAS